MPNERVVEMLNAELNVLDSKIEWAVETVHTLAQNYFKAQERVVTLRDDREAIQQAVDQLGSV